MIPINKRNIGTSILLSIVTFGIYLIYWEYLLVKNTRAIKKDNSSCTSEMLCLVFVPFYPLYWWYTRGKLVKDEFTSHGYSASGSEITYLVLGIFGLGIVSMAIMQNDFNSLPSDVVDASTQSNRWSAGFFMFCSQCGQQMKDGAKFCAYCGAKAPQQPTRVPAPGQTVVVSDQGMAWYKFVIWVQLWVSAVIFIGAGITILTGSHYRGRASLVYGLIPSLHTVDILFGLSLLAFAAYCVYTRFALAKFRRSGPTHYLWVYGLSIIIPVFYLICVYMVVNNYAGDFVSFSFSDLMGSDSMTELIVYIVIDIIMIVVNKIYFGKRKHLFVN